MSYSKGINFKKLKELNQLNKKALNSLTCANIRNDKQPTKSEKILEKKFEEPDYSKRNWPKLQTTNVM